VETYLRVLSDADRDRVHESTIKILAETGVKVETDLGRAYFLWVPGGRVGIWV